MARMKLTLPQNTTTRSRLVGVTSGLIAAVIFGALLIPDMESGLVILTIIFLSTVTGLVASAFVRYRARRRERISN